MDLKTSERGGGGEVYQTRSILRATGAYALVVKSIQSMKYVGKRGSRVTLRAIDRSVETIVVRPGVESKEMGSLKETLREPYSLGRNVFKVGFPMVSSVCSWFNCG